MRSSDAQCNTKNHRNTTKTHLAANFLRLCEKYLKGAMAVSETNSRKVVLGVDDSEHSERAFDCK